MAFPLNQASNSIPVQDISTPLFDQIEKVGQDLVGATSSMREFMKAEKENIPPSLLNTLDTFANKVNASTVRLSMLLKHPDLKKTKAPPKEEEKKKPSITIVPGPGMPILGPYENMEDASNALMLSMFLNALTTPTGKCTNPHCDAFNDTDSE